MTQQRQFLLDIYGTVHQTAVC